MRRSREIMSAHRPSYSTLWSALVYVTLRYLAFARANSTFGDSTGYHESSHFPLLSERFLAGRRSFPVPLFWKIVHGSETTIASAQLGLSVLCWWFLAQTVASMVHGRWMRVAAFWAILLFSLSATLVQWDRDLLSESVTLSLTAALFALSLRVVARPTPSLLGATLVVGLLWGFARDSNSAAVAVLVPVLLVVFARSKNRLALVAALAACEIFAADTVSAQVGHRADTSIQDLVQTRLFVDQPSARSWMEARVHVVRGVQHDPVVPELSPAPSLVHVVGPAPESALVQRRPRHPEQARSALHAASRLREEHAALALSKSGAAGHLTGATQGSCSLARDCVGGLRARLAPRIRPAGRRAVGRACGDLSAVRCRLERGRARSRPPCAHPVDDRSHLSDNALPVCAVGTARPPEERHGRTRTRSSTHAARNPSRQVIFLPSA